jgi:thiol-disulfide isomerase/thioredoxin
MVTTLVSTLTLLWTLWLAPAQATQWLPMTTPAVNQQAPVIRGKLMSGAEFDLAQKRGEVVLVDFWATWCEPCKLSLPRYAQLEKKLAGKGFSILTVSVDEDADVLKRFIATVKLGLQVLHDADSKVVERYAPPKMPTAFLVGRDGKIAWVHESFVPGDEAKVEAAVLQALAKAAP